MNVFEAVKQSVTTRQAAERYGIKVNRNGMCVCPFHNDKNPSMKVDRRFYCFGCGATGDVIDFVSRLHGIGSKEAALMLARDFSIPYEDGRNARKQPIRPRLRRESEEQKFKRIYVCTACHNNAFLLGRSPNEKLNTVQPRSFQKSHGAGREL